MLQEEDQHVEPVAEQSGSGAGPAQANTGVVCATGLEGEGGRSVQLRASLTFYY